LTVAIGIGEMLHRNAQQSFTFLLALGYFAIGLRLVEASQTEMTYAVRSKLHQAACLHIGNHRRSQKIAVSQCCEIDAITQLQFAAGLSDLPRLRRRQWRRNGGVSESLLAFGADGKLQLLSLPGEA